VVGRDAVGDAGVADLPLRPHEALRERRLGHQEGTGDLVGTQSAEGTQRERHLRLRGQRGMAAGEHEPQAVVGTGIHARLQLGASGLCQPGLLVGLGLQ